MTNLLIKDDKAYPTDEIRVEGMWGSGRLVYVTHEGWCGICLDGETRIDEYPAEQLGIEDTASDLLAALAV